MTGINHGMTGAVIALSLKNPALAIPLSLISHFAQDTLPHWNYGVERQEGKVEFFSRRFTTSLLIDFLSAVALMVVLALLFPAQKWLIWSCMVAAAAPDLMWAYYRLYIEHIQKKVPKLNGLAKFHVKVQWSQTAKGFYVEILWFLLMAGIILLHR
jgi:hypothetical protein